MKLILSGDSKPYREEIDKAEVATKRLSNNAGSAMSELAGAFGIHTTEIKGRIDSMSKNFTLLMTSMGLSRASAATFSGAMKIVKLAIAGTGIGLLIVALGSLIAYFTQTERGVEFVERAMAGLKAAFKVITDHAAKFGEGLFLIFSGKFQAGWAALKESAAGFGTEMKNNSKAAYDLKRRYQELEDAEKALALVNTERRANARELFARAKEEGTTAENKVKLIRQAMALEALAFSEEKTQAKERLAIHAEQVALGEARDEQNYKTLELQGAINNLSRDAANSEISYSKALKAATKEVYAQAEALAELEIKKARAIAKGGTPGKMKSITDVTVTTTLKTKTDGLESIDPSMALLGKQAGIIQAEDDIANHTVDMSSAVQGAFADMGVGLGEFLGDLMSGKGDIEGFGSAIAGAFADLAMTVGKQMIAFGVAGTVLKVLIDQPELALAAGVALVALGKLAKNSIASSLSGGGGATGAKSGAGVGYEYDARQSPSAAKMQTINVVVTGDLKAKGGDLVYVLNQEAQRKAIVT